MKEKGVKVTIPDFKGAGRSQLKEKEGKRSEKIAEAQIYMWKELFNESKLFRSCQGRFL